MTVMEGLSAASAAIGIVKELKDIDRSIDEATFKLKIADLTTALAEAKIALSDAKLALAEKDTEIRNLEAKVADLSSGELCPICKSSKMKTISVKPHPAMGDVGIQEITLKCENEACGHSENRMHDPTGLLKK